MENEIVANELSEYKKDIFKQASIDIFRQFIKENKDKYLLSNGDLDE